jgi:hypothetical protein
MKKEMRKEDRISFFMPVGAGIFCSGKSHGPKGLVIQGKRLA